MYLTYNFIDKDPSIDFVRTAIADSGMAIEDISLESGVSKSTITRWLYGKTKKPQAAPLRAVLRACNHDLQLVRLRLGTVVTDKLRSTANVVPLRRKFIKGRKSA